MPFGATFGGGPNAACGAVWANRGLTQAKQAFWRVGIPSAKRMHFVWHGPAHRGG